MTTTAPVSLIDVSLLRELGSERFGKAVDWDMRGNPITDCWVLLHGAYGPAVMRLVNLAVRRESAPIDKHRLAQLATEAFGQGLDRDFSGSVMTRYDVVLEESYGFGPLTLALVNLAITERDQLVCYPA